MMASSGGKVTARHVRRNAYLYVRQSTLRQVFENTESTKRQYALRERAVALGWPHERIIVIDSDQGHSAASATDREGFQMLVAEVGLGRAGIVLGLEVSRLARSSTDWHRLLEICALTDTLILDEDGIYDPGHFNDRLLLGLKGTMSEAELHVLRARLRGGILNKARRGDLEMPLPTGFVYAVDGKVTLDPDRQVQQSIRLFFETFRRTGSASATVKYFRQRDLLFPKRLRAGGRKGEVIFAPLIHSRALQVLRNPRYTGAFVFGQTRTRKQGDGKIMIERLPRDEWHSLIPDVHDGYISWAEYEENLRRLRENAQALGSDRRKSPPREGPALLQGLAICGVCGDRMTVRYHSRKGVLVPDYMCQQANTQRGEPVCQHIPGTNIDSAIGALLVDSVTPIAVQLTFAVQEELKARADEMDRLRHSAVERARYEAHVAERRYRQVDPDHRLVADALEGDWNDKLRALAEAEDLYQKEKEADTLAFDEAQRKDIVALTNDFPRLWNAPETSAREKKRIVRLLLEDVTLLRTSQGITLHVRFRGGASRTLHLDRPRSSWESWQTNPELVEEIDRLLEEYTEGEIAQILNDRNLCSGRGLPFTSRTIAGIRHRHGFKTRYERLRERGLLTRHEMASALGVHPSTISHWGTAGRLKGFRFNDKNECLYEAPAVTDPSSREIEPLIGFAPEPQPQSSAGGAV